ncbi:MAG: electron transfer flavoprotein subunit beta/FixA family protein, partial [Gammaproteobacteria bacterium]
NQTGQMLAGLLNWPQACFASKISFNNNLNNFDLTIDREIDTGLETLQLKLPAIITVDLLLNEPQRMNLNQLLQAKKKSIDIIDLQDLINKQLISLDFNQLKILSNNYSTVSVKNCIKINNPADLIQKLITEDKILIRY